MSIIRTPRRRTPKTRNKKEDLKPKVISITKTRKNKLEFHGRTVNKRYCDVIHVPGEGVYYRDNKLINKMRPTKK